MIMKVRGQWTDNASSFYGTFAKKYERFSLITIYKKTIRKGGLFYVA